MSVNPIMLLVDANSLIHRAYHAYPISLVNAQGQPVNAVYGFTSMLLDVLLRLKPRYVVCAFDSKAPTFRHKEYTGYKAHRPKTDADLTTQFKAAKQVVKSLNIPLFEVEGYEADDIIGTIVHWAEQNIFNQADPPVKKVYILANDKDLFQLVSPNVHILAPYKHFKVLQTVTPKKVEEILGVSPHQVVDYKALVGDPSDNIPGVKGIGPKTAVSLLKKYQTLDNIYKNLHQIAKANPSIARKLEDHYQEAKLSQDLATIRKDVPIVFDLNKALLSDFDIKEAVSTFVSLQFKSLIPKLNKLYTILTGKEPSFETLPTKANIQDITTDAKVLPKTPDNIIKLLKKSQKAKKPTLLIFTQDHIISAKLKTDLNTDCHRLETLRTNPLNLKLVTYGILNTLTDPQLIQEAIALLKPGVLDIQLAGYALITGRTSYTIEDLSTTYLGTSLSIDPANPKKAADIVANIALRQIEQITQICKQHTKPLADLIAAIDPYIALAVNIMHNNGICININAVKEYDEHLRSTLKDLEKKIHRTVGFEFNVRSTKQLADVLYNVLRLPAGKKRKTGYSTDVNTLMQLKGAHPVIDLLLEYRKLQKIHSTYVKPFLNGKYIDKDSLKQLAKKEQSTLTLQLGLDNLASADPQPNLPCAKIHSEFNPIRTTTGRLASSNPNLQNLPIRTEEGAKIRTFFIPSPGYVFVSFDYSQIDLRVLAHTSQDEHLIEAFIQGLDIHKKTASKIFNKPYDQITKQERRVAKTINFGIVYGMSAYGLSQSLGISMQDAKQFLDTYFEEFPKVREYMKRIEQFVLEHGYVLSLMGRRRYIAGITSNNPNIRQAAFREAINMPIQGGSDDIIRKAIRDLFLNIPALANNTIRLVLQIHDELVFEVPNKESTIQEFVEHATQIMQQVLVYPDEFAVPLKVEHQVKETL